MPFVILTRRGHLDNTTFIAFSQTCHTKEGEQYMNYGILGPGSLPPGGFELGDFGLKMLI